MKLFRCENGYADPILSLLLFPVCSILLMARVKTDHSAGGAYVAGFAMYAVGDNNW